ncbi:MAG: PAS domain S-box protein [Desulfobulbaceae bacterium]|nr:PAS domain S-box protein [Desulfobulbaceae bacterium]
MINKPSYEELEQRVKELEKAVIERKLLEETHQTSEKEYRSTLNNLLIGVVVHAYDTSILFSNPEATNILGLTNEQMSGKKAVDPSWNFVHEDSKILTLEEYPVSIVFSTKKPLYDYVIGIIRPDKDYRTWVIVNAIPVFSNDNEIEKVIVNFVDITALKQSEKKLSRLNVDLNAKNEELEQVVYVASHDLRSPLVNIDGYSRELEYSLKDLRNTLSANSLDNVLNELAPILDNDIPEAIRFIRTSTAKMDTLLAGLLRLSRSGRAALKKESLDMNQIISKVITSTEFRIKETDVEIIVDDLPPCQGDTIQMDQVFSNLLGNALKCLEADRHGRILISGQIVDKQSVYCVEDNGIGIDVNHLDKIFEIFHQLDPAHNKGEGLGLTIVKRILTRLDGAIRVESTIGLGSRFYVSMPSGNIEQTKGK